MKNNRVDFSAAVENEMKLILPSLSVNEGMARAAVAAFCVQADPSATELADIKCAVSEAVTNCIVHAYPDGIGLIYTKYYYDDQISYNVSDMVMEIGDAYLKRFQNNTWMADETKANAITTCYIEVSHPYRTPSKDSFIISRDAVNDISVWFGSRLALNLSVSTPERIVISKARVPKFKKWLTGGE